MPPPSLVATAKPASYDRAPMHPRVEPPPALTRNALIPGSIALCFVIVYVIELHPGWVFVVGALVSALYLYVPHLGRRSLARFDRDAVQLLARGERAGLEARYRRALGMRLFAAPALVAERRGLVAAEVGSAERARGAYLEALEGYGAGEAPLSVRLGLAHACYSLGDDEEAIRNYRAVVEKSGGLPRVAQRFAHSLARRGEALDEAERMVERLLTDAGDDPPADHLLLRALVYAKRGQKGPARKLVKETAEAEGELTAQLRGEIEEALGQ